MSRQELMVIMIIYCTFLAWFETADAMRGCGFDHAGLGKNAVLFWVSFFYNIHAMSAFGGHLDIVEAFSALIMLGLLVEVDNFED